jgi:hypothetical protein
MIQKMAAHLLTLPSLVITNCTTRKRAPHPPVSLPSLDRPGSLPQLARRWKGILRAAPRSVPAGELYVGRAMVESKRVCREVGAELYVVSAGLGLVHEGQVVPNYDLSASANTGVLWGALARYGKSVEDWWMQLIRIGAGGSIASLVDSSPRRLVLLALPASYMRLVAKDLAGIESVAAANVRIFTSEAGCVEVPSQLRSCVLPYTERLETLDGYDGTRAEFPQRALRHFVCVLGGHKLSLSDAQAAVRKSLSRLDFRSIPQRQRKTDEEIADLIRKGWVQCEGGSTRLHRYLRDDQLVACEQSRFRVIWRQLRAERKTGR